MGIAKNRPMNMYNPVLRIWALFGVKGAPGRKANCSLCNGSSCSEGRACSILTSFKRL